MLEPDSPILVGSSDSALDVFGRPGHAVGGGADDTLIDPDGFGSIDLVDVVKGLKISTAAADVRELGGYGMPHLSAQQRARHHYDVQDHPGGFGTVDDEEAALQPSYPQPKTAQRSSGAAGPGSAVSYRRLSQLQRSHCHFHAQVPAPTPAFHN